MLSLSPAPVGLPNDFLSFQALDITSCGNFAVIGSSCGRVDVYNLQSGLHRGCYGDKEKGEPGPSDWSAKCPSL